MKKRKKERKKETNKQTNKQIKFDGWLGFKVYQLLLVI